MDAILCRLQSFIEKVPFVRFRALSMWLGVGRGTRSRFSVVGARTKLKSRDTSMGKIIEFYVPDAFHNLPAEVPKERCGKVIVFRPRVVVLPEMGRLKSQPSAHVRNVSESKG